MKSAYRAVWISDLHLGTRNCQANLLLHFLRSIEVQHLYLVGDIFDLWALKRSVCWPDSHMDVVRQVMRMARHGTRVQVIPGNHDEKLREFLPITLGHVEFVPEAVHHALNGHRLWVVHGDDFDMVTKYHRWLAVLGDRGYDVLLVLNRTFNALRRTFGWGYWSLSAAVKRKVKRAVNFICDYEDSLAREARRRGMDGVVCGHIHHAEMSRIGDVLYLNCGDWVESCTAIVEHYDGRFEVIHHARGATAPASAPVDTPVEQF